jgi:D-psicose/D-tagatose/L-ribulose 3-epimerase
MQNGISLLRVRTWCWHPLKKGSSKVNYGIHQLLFTENFTEKDLPLLDKARELGFDGIEFVIFEPDTFPAAAVRRHAQSIGLRINTAIGLSAEHNLISPDPATRRRGIEFMQKLVDLSQQIDAENLTGVNYAGWGYLTGKMRTQQEWDWGVASFRGVCRFARENTSLKLCTEVVNRFESHFINIAADAVRFIDEVGEPNALIHLDTYHMIREEDSFAEAVRLCGKKLGYVHACESQRGIPGTGLVPWEEFFAALKSVGYDDWVTIESFTTELENVARLCCIWRKLADSPEQLASQGLAFLKNANRELAVNS